MRVRQGTVKAFGEQLKIYVSLIVRCQIEAGSQCRGRIERSRSQNGVNADRDEIRLFLHAAHFLAPLSRFLCLRVSPALCALRFAWSSRLRARDCFCAFAMILSAFAAVMPKLSMSCFRAVS